MKEKREELMNSSIFKLFIKNFIPILISSVLVVLYNLVDRFFVGKISEEALAAVGVSFYIVMIFIAFSMLVGVGAGTIYSIRLGQKKKAETQKILGNTITIFLILGALLFLILQLNLDKILLYSGANRETLPYAKTYLQIMLFAIIPLFFSYGMSNLLNAAGTPRVAMFSMLVGAVTNIILDYVAVMILKTGVEGTAYATLIGNVLAALIVMWFIVFGKLPFKINLFGYKLEYMSNIKFRFKYLKLFPKTVKDILTIGMSPFLLQLASSVVGLVTNKIVEVNGGTSGVAVVTIINSYLPIMTMTIYAVSQAMQPIIGFNYGAKRYNKVKKSLIMSILISIVLSGIFCLTMMMMPDKLVLFFNEKSTESALKEGVRALRIYFSTSILSSFGIIVPNYFQAIGRPKYSTVLNILRQVVIFLILMMIFSYYWKLVGVWYAQPATDIIFFVVLLIFTILEIKDLSRKQKNIEMKEREN